jgi:hypothetical protein
MAFSIEEKMVTIRAIRNPRKSRNDVLKICTMFFGGLKSSGTAGTITAARTALGI